jgi:hypothetical protein
VGYIGVVRIFGEQRAISALRLNDPAGLMLAHRGAEAIAGGRIVSRHFTRFLLARGHVQPVY